MNKEQKYSPKYWCAHDVSHYDVFSSTMSKSLDEAKHKFNYITDSYDDVTGVITVRQLRDGQIYYSVHEISKIKFILVEVLQVSDSETCDYFPDSE